MEESEIEKRKENLKLWLKDPHNLTFLGIMILAIVVRLFYFFLTKDQPLWWDEADYMAYAKNLAGIETHWTISPQHNSLFPHLASLLFRLALSEAVIKFILVVLPSILLVYLVYKICLMMYKDKRIALITSFLMAGFWNILFNSMRFHLGALALMFAFLAIYVFWQGYEKKEKIFGKLHRNWAIPLTAIFIILSYSIRRAFIIFALFFLIYILFTRKITTLIKNKYNWIAFFIAIAILFLVERTIFTTSILEVGGVYFRHDIPFNLIPFSIFQTYFSSLTYSWASSLLYLFYFGIALVILNLFLSVGGFKKQENTKARSDLFIFLMIALTLAYFLFYMKSPSLGDARWYLPLLLGSFVCISRGTIFISKYIKRYNKQLATISIIILIGFGGYYQLQHSDMIIKNKITSFNGIKQASLLIKQQSSPNDIIVSISIPQPAYYAERRTTNPAKLLNKTMNQDVTLEEFLAKLEQEPNIRYIIITFSEPNHPDWMRKDVYMQTPQTGQVSLVEWQIPFMDTRIDFTTGQQDIKDSKTYGDIEFKILNVIDDAFIYEINRV